VVIDAREPTGGRHCRRWPGALANDPRIGPPAGCIALPAQEGLLFLDTKQLTALMDYPLTRSRSLANWSPTPPRAD
jgi:hypothetical protein